MSKKYRVWFYNLSQREQVMIVIGGIVAVILAFYSVVWSPLQKHVADLRKQTLFLQSELGWIKHAKVRLSTLKKTNSFARVKVTNVMMQSEKSLAQAKLAEYLRKVQQPRQNEVSISLRNVSFDKMIAWLQSLVQDYQIVVLSFQSSPAKTYGSVNAQITLRAE